MCLVRANCSIYLYNIHIANCISALFIAVIHYLLFQYIDGRQADGPHRVVPQSYVSTISNILANTFGYSLRGGLALAFVQYLWRLLRVQTMKVSTIEMLFTIRANPFVLLRPTALKATPLLFVLAIVLWALQVVVSFPPGAITVTTVQRISYKTVNVPTFDASFVRLTTSSHSPKTDHKSVDGKWVGSRSKCIFIDSARA